MELKLCKCGNIRRPGQRYCRDCHAKWMRENRPKYCELKPSQKRKANARSHANTAKSRGQLVPQPCRDCGEEKVEMHHEDYDKPLAVIWLCRPCHRALHAAMG